jgi:predicted aspartyl protease
MGLFRVRGRLTGPTGRSEDVELLVDTGATLLVVPRSLADRLELVARRSQPVLIAEGQRVEWPVAEVSLSLDGSSVTTPCFIAPDGPALLGAVALESLFLAVDPVAKRLIPVEGFVGAAP